MCIKNSVLTIGGSEEWDQQGNRFVSFVRACARSGCKVGRRLKCHPRVFPFPFSKINQTQQSVSTICGCQVYTKHVLTRCGCYMYSTCVENMWLFFCIDKIRVNNLWLLCVVRTKCDNNVWLLCVLNNATKHSVLTICGCYVY